MLKEYKIKLFSIDPPPKEYVLYTWFNIDNYGWSLESMNKYGGLPADMYSRANSTVLCTTAYLSVVELTGLWPGYSTVAVLSH